MGRDARYKMAAETGCGVRTWVLTVQWVGFGMDNSALARRSGKDFMSHLNDHRDIFSCLCLIS